LNAVAAGTLSTFAHPEAFQPEHSASAMSNGTPSSRQLNPKTFLAEKTHKIWEMPDKRSLSLQ